MAARRSPSPKPTDQWNFDGPGNIQALSFSDTGVATGAVVFAGYGLVVPDTQNFGYDSYAGLDVKDKIVVVLRYFPEDADQKTRGILARYADLRYKAQAARQRGAKGHDRRDRTAIAERRRRRADDVRHGDCRIGTGRGQHQRRRRRRRFSRRPANSSRPCRRNSIAATRTSPDLRFPDLTVTLNANVDPPAADRPQRGRLPAGHHADDRREQAVGERGRALRSSGPRRRGNSLAEKPNANEIHHGADDNASGTATVLAIGEALSKQPRKRNLLLAFWSGEELGLIGSNYFVTKPPVADRSDRGVPELRHGRPRQRQQAHRAGHRHERDLAEAARAGQRRGRLRSHVAGGSVSAHRRRQLQRRRASRR